MNVQNCYDYFALYTDGEEIDETIFLIWINSINQESYKIMYNLFPNKYLATKSFPTVIGQQEYTFTDISLTDFHSFGAGNTGVFVLDNGVITETLPYTDFGTSKRGYYLEGEKIVLTPAPTAVETLTMRYIKSISSVTTNTENKITTMLDNLVLPDGFEDLVGEEILTRFWKQQEETELMGISGNFAKKFKARLTSLDEYKPEGKGTIKGNFMRSIHFTRR